MRKEAIVPETTIRTGDAEITVLSKQSITWLEVKGVFSFTATKQPVYILISRGGNTRAFDTMGQEVPIHQAKPGYSSPQEAAP